MQELYERVAAPPPAGQLLAQRVCAKCARRGDSLKLCSRCRSTWYCSKECQKVVGGWEEQGTGKGFLCAVLAARWVSGRACRSRWLHQEQPQCA
jgi:hypothetical protein